MEIWGGNQAMDAAIAVPGLDVWVYSRPYAGAAGGGDIYYVSQCIAGNLARVALADVSGHGSTVDELAHELRSLMRRNINTPDRRGLREGSTGPSRASPRTDGSRPLSWRRTLPRRTGSWS